MRTSKWSWVNNSELILYFIHTALLFLLMGSTEMKRFPQTYLSYELDSLKKAYAAMGWGALEVQALLWRCEWLGKSDCVTSVLSLTKETKIPAPVILNLAGKCRVLSIYIVNPKKLLWLWLEPTAPGYLQIQDRNTVFVFKAVCSAGVNPRMPPNPISWSTEIHPVNPFSP